MRMQVRCGKLAFFSGSPEELFRAGDSGFSHIVTVNAEIFVYAHEHKRFLEMLTRTVNTVDGRILQWFCKMLNPRRRVVRLAGSDFIYDLASYCEARSERLFLLGATESSNWEAVAIFKRRHPHLNVSGFSPEFCEDPHDAAWAASILERLREFRPHHLVVCFGPEKQENWIAGNASSLALMGVKCAYGLGGSIDFVSGTRRRAPRWIQMIGAEWLFRFASEPRTRFRRTLTMFKLPMYVVRT